MKSLLLVLCVLIVYTYAETNIHFNFDGMIPDLPVCGCGSVCGDGICSADENELTCPNDCVVIQPDCGDGSCDSGSGEDPFTCPEDCSRCGDGVCDNTESLTSCLPDCVACGDGICSTGETLQACPADCSNICGNGACETGESSTTCPQDCQCQPQCTGKTCGSDGCGGSCGTCPTGQSCSTAGVCVCTPQCTGRTCGTDGCGGSCGTCPTGQTCNTNGVCVCTPQCTGKTCGDDGCGGSCGTCPSGQFCNVGVCQDDTGSRMVQFSVIQISGGFAGNAAGVTVESATGSSVTDSTGSASVMVPLNGTVTFSGSGYETISVTIFGTSTSMMILVPPPLSPGQVIAAGLWGNTNFDLDFNMFGPGNRTQYPSEEGVVNWTWEDKSEQLPYASWTDMSADIGAEIIDISKMDTTSIYDFMLFHWSRVGQNDDTGDFSNADAYVFIFGASDTGIGNWAFSAVPPTPPSGSVYGFYSPFRLNPSTNGLVVEIKTNPFEPPISISDIEAFNPIFYNCAYPTYCPYSVPL